MHYIIRKGGASWINDPTCPVAADPSCPTRLKFSIDKI
jgi:hypothetical protein